MRGGSCTLFSASAPPSAWLRATHRGGRTPSLCFCLPLLAARAAALVASPLSVGGCGTPRNGAHVRGRGPARHLSFLRPPTRVGGGGLRRASTQRLISGGGRVSPANQLGRHRLFLLAHPLVPPFHTNALRYLAVKRPFFCGNQAATSHLQVATLPACAQWPLADTADASFGVTWQPTPSSPQARSVTWIRVCVARLSRHRPGVIPVRAFRDIRQDMGM